MGGSDKITSRLFCITLVTLTKMRTSHNHMIFIVLLFMVVMVTGVWSCSDWYQNSPCFCSCEDVATECKKNCVPHYKIPHDEIVKNVCDTYCKFDSLNCMRNCVGNS